MQIPVVVEPIGSGQFRAQVFAPLTAAAEGATSDEALSKLRDRLNKEVENGKRLVLLDVPVTEDNPWLAMAGWLKDDPMFEDWQLAIQEYRRECDIEAGIDTNETK